MPLLSPPKTPEGHGFNGFGFIGSMVLGFDLASPFVVVGDESRQGTLGQTMGVGPAPRPLVIDGAGSFGYFGCLDLEIHVPYHGLSVSAHSILVLGTVNFDV